MALCSGTSAALRALHRSVASRAVAGHIVRRATNRPECGECCRRYHSRLFCLSVFLTQYGRPDQVVITADPRSLPIGYQSRCR